MQSPLAPPSAQQKNTTDPSSIAANLRFDLVSGFLVFLIALPLCLAIAGASGFPAIAGLFTAIVGGIVCSLISNSELTIKGPAAGMIVIVLGAITAYGGSGKFSAENAADLSAYEKVLAVGVVAGILQMVFGALRAGALGELFPTAAVHGLLASIGVIIMSKQIHLVFGQSAPKESLDAIQEIPHSIAHANPYVAIVGVTSLVLMFGLNALKSRLRLLRIVPIQLIVLVVAIPLAAALGFSSTAAHSYTWRGSEYSLVPDFLVRVPTSFEQLRQAIVFPDFKGAVSLPGVFATSIMMFALVGTLESLLSAKAIDLLDPWQRKTNLNRDLFAVGTANTLVAAIGGLPMISEIVRSSANKDNGARTRMANLFHGLFLLVFLLFLPGLINLIPKSALAAMLVFTGFRLASPKEFAHMYHIGTEQLIVFVATIVGVLATDLLVGIGIGVAVELAVNLYRGVRPWELFKQPVTVSEEADHVKVVLHDSAVFSSWIAMRKQLANLPPGRDVLIDFSQATLVDHTVMSKLADVAREFVQQGCKLELTGLDGHDAVSHHPHAARRRAK